MAIGKLPIPLGGGVNLHKDPIAIPDGQWQRLRNLAPRLPGVLGQRPSLSFVREVVPNHKWWDARALKVGGGAVNTSEKYYQWAKFLRPIRFLFDPNYGEITMVAITLATVTMRLGPDRTGITSSVPAGTMLVVALPGQIGTDGTDPGTTLECGLLGPITNCPSLFVFNGITYAFGGYNNGIHIETATTTSAVEVPFTYTVNNFGTANEDFNPTGACVVRDRVLYYKGPNVYFSDRNEPLTVGYTGSLDADGNIVPSTANPVTGTNYNAEDTRGIYLGGEELEDITAVAEVNTSADGSPVQSVAMVFTSTHAYMLLGEPLETTEGGDILGSLQINRLNVQAGCISQASIVRTPYGTVWCGRDDVWFMPFGSLPIRIGTSIRPLLEQQPAGLLWKIHAEYADGFYRISLFTPGQGPSIYDPCGMQMWLDMRDGGPRSAEQAQWFGPQEFNLTDAPTTSGGVGAEQQGVYCMARDTRATGDGKLYALQSFAMIGSEAASPDAVVLGMSLCDFAAYNGKDTAAPQLSSPKWVADTDYFEGDILVPTPQTTSFVSPVYLCTTSGTSGAGAEPNWFSPSATGTITDNSVVWTLRYWDGTNVLSGHRSEMEQAGNEIELSMLSKEFVLGDPMREKLLDGAELGYFATDRTQVTHNSHPKQDSRSRILGLTAEQTADNVANQTTGDRVWQRKLLTPAPTKRFHGLSATFELEQDAGIVITAGVNDTIVLTTDGVGPLTVTITAGYYADLAALVTEVITAAGLAFLTTGITSTITADGSYARALVGLRSLAFGAGGITVGTATRLAQLLGYSEQQGATVTAAGSDYAFGYESPRIKYAPDIQFSGLTLRFKTFGRGPT